MPRAKNRGKASSSFVAGNANRRRIDAESVKKTQSYENRYRITARFLLWVSQNYDKNLVEKLDEDLRTKTYTAETWEQYTGKTVDQLWEAYTANPEVSI